MMSLTVNLPPKTVHAAPHHLEVHLQGPLAPRVQSLLQQIREVDRTLPEDHQGEVRQAIDEWEQVFFDEYLDADREEAAHALLFLRLNTIQYVMLNYAENDTQKLKWLEIYNEMEKIVTSILPQHIDVKAFIDADTQKQLEDRLRYRVTCAIDEVLPKIAEDFAGLEKRLYENVDWINKEMQLEFEGLKNSLTQLMMDRKVSIGEIRGELQRHTGQIERIFQEMEKQLNEMQDQGKRMELKDKALVHLLDACEAVIRKV